MTKIIHVKYSNERDDKFKIKTVIEQDDFGKRCVKKYAMTEAAKTHIVGIEKHQKLLSQNADGTKLHFNSCTLRDNYITCEYVDGEPLSSILLQKITKKNEQAALALLNTYCVQLQQLATVPFVVTEEFQQVFGNADFLQEQKSCVVTDIDLIFSNILVDRDRWNVIDLEWVFDFPIPVNFLLYRAIFYSGSHIQEFAERFSILKNLGIGSAELAQFAQMEKHFQNWVKGSTLSLAEMECFQKRTSIAELNNKIRELNTEIDGLKSHISSITEERDHLRRELTGILESKTWKYTEPVRSLKRRIRP